jgi:hypothetical protein
MLYISKILFLLAIVLSAMSISILKERVDKKDALLSELNIHDEIFKNFAKNTPSCLSNNDNTEKCNGFKVAEADLKNTRNQVNALKVIDDHGLPASICGSIPSIASGSPGFELDCYKLEKHEECNKLVEPKDRSNCLGDLDNNYKDKERHLIIYNSIKNNFRYFYFDRLPSELLYFILVLFCSLIGSIYKLKSESKDLSSLKCTDIVTSFSQGFIAYIIITGAKYVVGFGNQGLITNINPYSVAFIGCLAGMFFDSFFNIKSKLDSIPAEPTPGVG